MQKQPPEVFFIKLALQNFAKFTGKHLCQSLFLNKVASLSIKNIKNIKNIYPCLKGDPDRGVSCDFARFLNLIWVGFLGFCFEGVNLPPPLSKTRWNYARNFKFDT